MKVQQERLNAYAQMNTKNIQPSQQRKTMQNKANLSSGVSEREMDDAMKNADSKMKTGSGSMFEKAGMVKKYNDKNNK